MLMAPFFVWVGSTFLLLLMTSVAAFLLGLTFFNRREELVAPCLVGPTFSVEVVILVAAFLLSPVFVLLLELEAAFLLSPVFFLLLELEAPLLVGPVSIESLFCSEMTPGVRDCSSSKLLSCSGMSYPESRTLTTSMLASSPDFIS